MTKDVPDFMFPAPPYDAGKFFRHFLEAGVEHAKDDPFLGGGYGHLQEMIYDFEKRFGSSDVQSAAAIAFAYLGHLVSHGVIPPLKPGMYI